MYVTCWSIKGKKRLREGYMIYMMIGMEEVLCELSDDEKRIEEGLALPPGFRFHPTDEELIAFYLASKVFNASFTTNLNFAVVDLNSCEPWELPEVAKMGEREWYLLSLRDRKYPTGLRTNRATGAGYWKATGKDKEVYSSSSSSSDSTSPFQLLGMKKTLVFYKGRAPRGEKTKWVMHEYRLDPHFSSSSSSSSSSSKEEWVICRIFHKSGDKRNSMLRVQGQFHVSSSPTKPCFPPSPLLPTPSPSSFSSTLLMELEYCQSLMHQHPSLPSHPFPFHHKPPSFPSTNTISSFSNPFFTHQSPNIKVKLHQTAPQATKTESTTFYQHQLLPDDPNCNMPWMDDKYLNPTNPSNFHNSIIPLEVDGGNNLMAFSVAGGGNAEFRDISSSTAFNRVGLMQQVLDTPIGIDSWPQPQHA